MNTVLKQWNRVPGATCTEREMGRRAGEWLLGLSEAIGARIELASDDCVAIELLESAMRSAGIWDRVQAAVAPVNVGVLTGTIEGERAAEALFQEIDVVRGLCVHHALADAHALRAAYRAVTRPQRVIFLDFDGVLHPESVTPSSSNRFEYAADLEHMLTPWPDVRIVVHSSWRVDHSVEQLRALLGVLGPRVIDVTPRLQREDSILAAVEQLRRGGRQLDWCVLDDAPEEFSKVDQARLIVCDPETGVSAQRVQAELRGWLERGGQ
ncbi:HAD domain-containing protein [Rubrivivax gelatinosus]|uniref:HAD domain-containing protein n=1 Tax=Rubrivivax gelatinosus TaxID=28068 RepID=UPI0012FD06EE|nr:HAD domain-containing protein [Rubrivivax gelatinosus]MBG6082434.1 hypothetical protein [Rubrivivax gelatinosus]